MKITEHQNEFIAEGIGVEKCHLSLLWMRRRRFCREKVFQLGSQCWILKHYRHVSWSIHIEYS